MKRLDTDRGRFYDIPGVGVLPSVTTILKVMGKGPALINWAANLERELAKEKSYELYEMAYAQIVEEKNFSKMTKLQWFSNLESFMGKTKAHAQELKNAADIGSMAHAAVEWSLKVELGQKRLKMPECTGKALIAFEKWQEWRNSVKLKPILIEQTVFDSFYGYAGTMDLLAEVDGKVALLDWKTSKSVWPEMFLQNAAYRSASESMGHPVAELGIIVRLPKKETDDPFEVKECPDLVDSFDVFLKAKSLWEWQQKMESADRGRRAHVPAIADSRAIIGKDSCSFANECIGKG